MANTKTGLNYYNVDTDRYQDRRIKRLKKDCGCEGLAVYDYVLCETYRVRGCYLEYDENTVFDVAEYFGVAEKDVRSIVEYCGRIGLFDERLLSQGVITSASIQRRYIEVCTKAKRKVITIPAHCRIDASSTSKDNCRPGIAQSDEQYRLSLDDEIATLKDDEEWCEQLMALHKIEGKNKLFTSIDQFRMQCIADGKEQHQSLNDAKQHFNSWLRKVTTNQSKKADDKVRSATRSKRRGNILTANDEKKYGDTF